MKYRLSKMAAELENKYAEKWTIEQTEEMFDRFFKQITQDKDIVFIGELAAKNNIYRELIPYLYNKYKSSSEKVFNTYKNIHSVLEARLYKGALDGTYRERAALFGLTANHEWTGERNETKIDGQPISIVVNTSGVQPIRNEKDIDE